MTPITLHTPGPNPNVLPMALIFPYRRLLTEKSSVMVKFESRDLKLQTLEIRATRVTTILNQIPGYSHHGINE